MRALLVVAPAAVILLIGTWPARSQEIPALDVDPVCRGIAQQAVNPTEEGGPDLAFAQCVKSEHAMREQLAAEWSTFIPSEKANCVGAEISGMASYTDLVTCLEMARAARNLNR